MMLQVLKTFTKAYLMVVFGGTVMTQRDGVEILQINHNMITDMLMVLWEAHGE